MTSKKWAQLIETLVSKTLEKNIEWVYIEDSNVVITAVKNYIIKLYPETNSYTGEKDMALEIANKDGTIDKINDVAVKLEITSAFTIMKNLHALARDQAIGIDDALDDILGELE